MSGVTVKKYKGCCTATAVPKLNPCHTRTNSEIPSVSQRDRKESERNLLLSRSPYTASVREIHKSIAASSSRRNLVSNGTTTPKSPPLPLPFRGVQSSSAVEDTVNNTHSPSTACDRAAAAPPCTKPVGCAEQRRKYVVATMRHCGSMYEEMMRQLLATGRWSHVSISQRAITKSLCATDTQRDLSDMSVHLLLGEKMPCERVVAMRRVLSRRHHSHSLDGMDRRNSSSLSRLHLPTSARMPMGSCEDGEVRVVDFVENTRVITLKSSMVSTLLKYHKYDWNELGEYLPMSFKLQPRQPNNDERHKLLATTTPTSHSSYESEERCMWIAKSSAGCHGDNIEIFSGDYQGILKLLRFIDDQRDSHAWIAQQYIDRPLLYHKRKFDIRCWALLLRDKYEIYVHEELVMRMSSVPYVRDTATSKTAAGRLAHITNHCIQEASESYSIHEEGNELWREHLDGLVRYKGTARAIKLKSLRSSPGQSPPPREQSGTDSAHRRSPSINVTESLYPVRELSRRSHITSTPRDVSIDNGSAAITLEGCITPQIHFIVRETLLAVRPYVPNEPPNPPTHTFQVFGYDFLIDESFKVWLLEINGAPGGPERLKPLLVKDTIELAIAPYFPGTMNVRAKRHNGYVRVYP